MRILPLCLLYHLSEASVKLETPDFFRFREIEVGWLSVLHISLNLAEEAIPQLSSEERAQLWLSKIEPELDDEGLRFHEALQVMETEGLPAAEQRTIDTDIWRSGQSIQATGKADLLTRVLQAFAIRRPDIGYVQGMNYIAAEFLVLGMSETQAYIGLVYFVEVIGEGYFEEGFPGFEQDAEIIEDLIDLVDVDTAMDLESLQRMEPNLPVVRSLLYDLLLTFFARSLAPPVTLRVWDAIFLHGKTGVYATALALIVRTKKCYEILIDSPMQNFRCFSEAVRRIQREETEDLIKHIARIIAIVQ